MKTFLVALTLVATLASAPFASAQQPDEVVAKTHWSYEVLKKLTTSLDINVCRDDTQIRYTDFHRDDFRFNRRQAALAMWQILDRLESLKEKNIVLTYKSKDDITNGFDIGNVETKEAILALCIEYQKEVKQFDINEQWLRTNVSGYLESQTSDKVIPSSDWTYEALAKICGYLNFDSQSWLPIELYGGKNVRPIILTRREVVLLLRRILSESKVASGFNARTFKVQQIHEAEVIEYIVALRTEFADDLASLSVRFGAPGLELRRVE